MRSMTKKEVEQIRDRTPRSVDEEELTFLLDALENGAEYDPRTESYVLIEREK